MTQPERKALAGQADLMASQDPGHHPCGEQPDPALGATAALAPCPFCGPGNSIPGYWFDDATQAWRVSCGRCGSGTGFRPRWSESDAAKAWNTRGDVAAPARELDLVRQMAAEGVKWDQERLDAIPKDYVGPGFTVGQYWRDRLSISKSWQAFCADPINHPGVTNLPSSQNGAG